MKTKITVLALLLSIFFISAKKGNPPVFTLKNFDKTLSKISDKFYMSKYEVANFQYMAFLNDLKKQGDMGKYKIALLDTQRWITNDIANKPFATYYHTHPAYANYPVVNVSYDGAVLFCKWLTDKYNAYDKRKFKKVLFRLPTQAEWKNAASGGLKENAYSWGGYWMTDYKGRDQCNYLHVGDANIHYNDSTKSFEVMREFYKIQESDITCPVNSYSPNGYGLYNMSGNAAEMVSEKGIACGGSYRDPGYDVQVNSKKKYTHPENDIGFRVCMDVIEQ